MTISIIPLPTVVFSTLNGSTPFGQFISPDGSQIINVAPDGSNGGRSVELRGDGEFIGTNSSDETFSSDDQSKTIFGLGGDDGGTFFGTGAITFIGNEGADIFQGGLGNDTFYGGTGFDRGFGNEGNDLIFGDLDRDWLGGDLGDDTLLGGPGDDLLDERDGTFGENNLLFGGSGNDLLVGGLGNELLSGDIGNDEMRGNEGNDTLSGGEGFDILTGGFRSTSFTGGDQTQDVFALEVNSEFDLVTDYEDGIDKIGLPVGLTFNDLLITSLGNQAEILNSQIIDFNRRFGFDDLTSEATDIAIKLATTDQILMVLKTNTGDDPNIPVLDASQITAEDFLSFS